MPLGLQSTIRNAVLNWLYRGTAFPSADANIYLSLHTADPGDTGASECPNSNGYARTSLRAFFGTAAASGSISNDTLITLFTPSGTFASPVTHVGVWTSSTYGAGTFRGGGALSSPFTPQSGQPYTIPVGDLVAALT